MIFIRLLVFRKQAKLYLENVLQIEIKQMQDNRKYYRKKFTSTGIISFAGEQLEYVSYDVSVKGIQIELQSGEFISSANDVRNWLNESQEAEVYVHDLGLSADAKVAWVLEDEGKILLGLEFFDVQHNASKLWVKRRYYRKSLVLQASFIFNEQKFEAQTVDVSADGMRLECAGAEELKVGDAIKLFVQEKDIKAIAVVIWLKSTPSSVEFGVRYITIS